jgi:hypothetical protein
MCPSEFRRNQGFHAKLEKEHRGQSQADDREREDCVADGPAVAEDLGEVDVRFRDFGASLAKTPRSDGLRVRLQRRRGGEDFRFASRRRITTLLGNDRRAREEQ